MLKIVQKYICEFILLISVILLFSTRDTKIPHDKMIIADGLGYYSYLPATFIYHDFSFNFFNPIYPKYYPPGFNPPTKNFINEFDGIKLNKYFPGVSILALPFFLMAHVLSYLFGYSADGYSPIYQYFMGLSAIFYCFLGLRFLKKILAKFNFNSAVQTFVIAALFFGTNLFYQTIYYPSASHVYSFFLIAGLCYYLILLFDNNETDKSKHVYYSLIFIAFITITRPQNVLILLLLPFFGATFPKTTSILKQLFSSYKIWIVVLLCIFIVSIVPLLWYIQTGELFLNPYQGEHYYFNKPHFFEALFSFRKGWLLYTPLMILCLLGIAQLKNISKSINVLLFFIILIYINSSWWSWTYGPTSFSQRALVDFYIIPGILLAHFIQNFALNFYTFFIKIIIVLICILNIVQTHQFRKGIIPGDFSSSENYFNNFFQLKSIAYFPIPKEMIVQKQTELFYFDTADAINDVSHFTTSEFYSEKKSTFTCAANNYSALEKIQIPAFLPQNDYSIIRASAFVKSKSAIGKCTLVLDFVKNGKSESYNGFEIKNFVHSKRWEKVEFGLNLPTGIRPVQDSLVVYFWDNEANDTAFIDNLKVEFITTNDSYELKP
jgi:hypothetical protein